MRQEAIKFLVLLCNSMLVYNKVTSCDGPAIIEATILQTTYSKESRYSRKLFHAPRAQVEVRTCTTKAYRRKEKPQ